MKNDDETLEELVVLQRYVNEQLVFSALRAHEAIDVAEEEVANLRDREAALLASEAELRSLADSMPVLAWYAAPDGSMAWFNRRWVEYTGFSMADREGRTWESVQELVDAPRILAKWEEARATGQPWEDEFRLRRHDGKLRWFLARAVPLRDRAGTIVRWLGTHVDIDDQKATESAQSRLREEAENANRIKDDFLATMSHELRTPLNAILGWASMLRRGVHSEATDRALATIERNAKTQTRLIEDMLDVSRIMSGKLRLELRSVDFNDIARAALEMVAPMAEAKSVRIDVNISTRADAALAGDPVRLQQVLWNLLTNAVKFTPAGGNVSLKITRVDDEARAVITDSGPGIDASDLSVIFDRFRQVDSSLTRKHGGLGLGLAIARHIMELHGGSVMAESRGVGQGSTFTVALPIRAMRGNDETGGVVERESEPSVKKERSEAPPPSAPLTTLTGISILIVEDDDESRAILESTLIEAGATVTVAASARAAHALLESVPVDVVVSDIGMPDEDGYSFMRRVRASPADRLRDVPAVALSAYARKGDAEGAHEAGYQKYITKPVDMSELTKTIAELARGDRHGR